MKWISTLDEFFKIVVVEIKFWRLLDQLNLVQSFGSGFGVGLKQNSGLLTGFRAVAGLPRNHPIQMILVHIHTSWFSLIIGKKKHKHKKRPTTRVERFHPTLSPAR